MNVFSTLKPSSDGFSATTLNAFGVRAKHVDGLIRMVIHTIRDSIPTLLSVTNQDDLFRLRKLGKPIFV